MNPGRQKAPGIVALPSMEDAMGSPVLPPEGAPEAPALRPLPQG